MKITMKQLLNFLGWTFRSILAVAFLAAVVALVLWIGWLNFDPALGYIPWLREGAPIQGDGVPDLWFATVASVLLAIGVLGALKILAGRGL